LHNFVRYAGVPVDFEEVQMDPKSESNEDLEYAITSIRRNGVAIKGNLIILGLLDLRFLQ
jgi:isocitrate dehydrogenase (NAD+)